MQKNFEDLIGRYIIIEATQDELSIIPDFSGRVDLFYTQKNKLKVSNNIKDLAPFIDKKINYPALAHSLSIYGFRSPKKNTIFDEINRAPVKAIIKIKRYLTIEETQFHPRKIKNNIKKMIFMIVL